MSIESPVILDGYTWPCKIGGRVILYRPSLKIELVGLHATMSAAGPEIRREFLIERLCAWGNNYNAAVGGLNSGDLDRANRVLLGLDSPGTDCPWSDDWEARSAENLREGAILLRDHPVFAKRDCSACKAWWYNDETGAICTVHGKPLERPPGSPLLCETREGCPKGTPENPRSLSAMNRLAYQHFLRCDAIGIFPDDPIVARNAAIIRGVLAGA